MAPELERPDALLAHAGEAGLHPLGAQPAVLLQHAPDDAGVERAGQPPVAGHRDEGDGPFFVVRLQQRVVEVVLRVGGQVAHHLDHGGGVGAQGLDALLVAAQFGGRDHLHGLGDLARILD